MTRRPDGTEAVAAAAFRLAQQIEVDLDLVDLLHAPHVGVPELLVGVDERAGAVHAGGRIDHLVAVDGAATALHLVLRAKRQSLLGRRPALVYAQVVGVTGRAAQDVTRRVFSGMCGRGPGTCTPLRARRPGAARCSARRAS